MSFAGITSEQVQLFLLCFVRITAMLTLLPIFGTRTVPVYIKVGLSLCTAIIVFPLTGVHGTIDVPLRMPLFVAGLVKETTIGIIVGFAASLLFTGVQFAGRLTDQQMGFGFVQLVDPLSDEQVTTTGQLQVLVYTILFLLINGHYFMLLAIEKSFDVIPLFGMTVAPGPLASRITVLVAGIFVTAIKLAAPMYVTLLLTSLALGVVARTVPQINIFFVGLPLKILLGLFSLYFAFPLLATVFQKLTNNLMGDIWKLLYLMA